MVTPMSWGGVDRAEGAYGLVAANDEGDSDVGLHVSCVHGRVAAHERVGSRVVDPERRSGGDCELAKGIFEGGFTKLGPRRGDTGLAGVQLVVLVNESDYRNWHV